MATAVVPSADQNGAPESPEQAPAIRPSGSAAQTSIGDTGARTARPTLRRVPPEDQSPGRVAPKPDRITESPTPGPSPDARAAPENLAARGFSVRTSATSIEATRAFTASGR
jgi:hypothetical protein